MNAVLKIAPAQATAMLALGFLAVIAMMVLPTPPILLDIGLTASFALAILVLTITVFIERPLDFSAFPTVLLATLMLRLALNIASTRLIIGEGHTGPDAAGSVIHGFAMFVMGGNIFLGLVVFCVILIVNFMVITKGAGRMAEVGARFALDGMPGRQLAIDSDVAAGAISHAEARERRRIEQEETTFFGSLDGASKFVKGDAICTIIIALVNIIAGLAAGVLMHGLTFAEAANKYTIATFGDGLAAIISSLLITLSAGIVVTRVSSHDETSNVGADIGAQIFTSPRPLFITGGIMLLLTPLNLLFVPVGAAAAGVGYLLYRRQKRLAEADDLPNMANANAGDSEELQMSFTVPMAVVVSRELTYLVDKNTKEGARFRAEIPKLRNALYYDLGVMVPFCYVGGDAPISSNELNCRLPFRKSE